MNRSSYRYMKKENEDTELKVKIRELALKYPRYGSPRIYDMLRLDGIIVNHKKVERIYAEEDLSLRRKKRKRIKGEDRDKSGDPKAPNKVWSMDFVSDSLAGGRRFRTFNVMDEFTREALATEPDTSITGSSVVRIIEKIALFKGYPLIIKSDNGPEFQSRAFQRFCKSKRISHEPITPGKPIENCFIESFNGKFRDECLNLNWFTSLAEARRVIEKWRLEYNEIRPHRSLGRLPPKEFIARFEREEIESKPLCADG